MPIEITMPRLSDTMQQGSIVKWNVKEGQKVKSGDEVADVETDKATMGLPVYEDGTVAKIIVGEGQAVPVGTLIMLMAAAGEDVATVSKAAPSSAGTVKASAQGGRAASHPSSATSATTAVMEPSRTSQGTNGHSESHGRVFVSPLARKIAAESNVDLGSIQGSGPGGRIIRKDVEAALGGGAAGGPVLRTARAGGAPMPEVAAMAAGGFTPAIEHLSNRMERLASRTIPLSNMRRVIAERLVESKSTIPHYQVSVDVDMDALMSLRGQLNEQLGSQGIKLSVNDFLVRACALAMHPHPHVNSRWAQTPQGAAIELLAEVNIGIAIALPIKEDGSGGGLVVATIRDADQIGLRQISARSKQLSEKARTRGLTPQEMSDSTFTISNLGMFGVSHFTAIINPPNVAILAVGAAIQRPVVKGDRIVPGWVMSMTMSSDHRVVDGAMAAQYLATVRGLLEKPATLLV